MKKKINLEKFLIDELSVILPVYNGERTLKECLKAIFTQVYYPPKFEIIVINDGSTDQTKEIAKQFPIHLINFTNNKGRITARDEGVKRAKYNYVQFIDADCIATKTWILDILKKNYEPIQGQVINVSEKIVDRFFYLLRRRFYLAVKKPIFINNNNFLRIPKGLGNFMCSKKRYSMVNYRNRGEYFSDDQYLIYEMNKNKEVLAIPESIVYHNERVSMRNLLLQWFQRGSRFADFYLKRGGLLEKSFRPIIIIFLCLSIFLLLVLGPEKLLISYLLLSAFITIMMSLYASEKITDSFTVAFFLPPVSIVFLLGIIRRKLPWIN